METIELVFTWGVPLLVIYFLYRSKGEVVNINNIFKQLALENHGVVKRRTWFDYPTLTIHEQGFTFHLGSSLAPGGNVWVTRLNMAHRQTVDFTLRIQPHSRLEKMATAIGFQDAAIGTPEFNNSYLVKTDNETKSRHFINEGLQQALLQIKHLQPELSINKTSIVLTTSFQNNAENFQTLVDFGKLLCTRLQNISGESNSY